jgi:hypothetical protein
VFCSHFSPVARAVLLFLSAVLDATYGLQVVHECGAEKAVCHQKIDLQFILTALIATDNTHNGSSDGKCCT